MNSLFLRRLTLVLIGVVIILTFGIAVKYIVLKFQEPVVEDTSQIVENPDDSVVPEVSENIIADEDPEVNEEVENEVEDEDEDEDEQALTPPVSEPEPQVKTEAATEAATEAVTATGAEVAPKIESKPLKFENVSFFMESYMERYEAFAVNEPTFTADEVVLKVNMNLDYDFYTNIVEIEQPDNLLVICNKFNQLPSDFTPQNLLEVPKEYHVNDGKAYDLDQNALNAFIEMSDRAKEEGISLKIISAYRSNEFQAYLYNKYKTNNGIDNADRYSARPGHSEHETGLAIDINDVSKSFEDTSAFKWLQENAHDYGYILRYPKNMEAITGYMYEPWHYRYVGVETATKIRSENITFDAYYAINILPNKNR